MPLTAIGTVAFDSVETPYDKRERTLGGSATYFAVASCRFGEVGLVAVVGEDFPDQHFDRLRGLGVDCRGVEVAQGETFYWAGRYEADWNTRHTLETRLNVFEHFDPKVPAEYEAAPFVFLANAEPKVQARALEQFAAPELVVADTMNLWIDIARDDLVALLQRVDGLVLNDEEARMLSGERNLLKAARAVLGLGPKFVILKKGEHGAFLIGEDVHFSLYAGAKAGLLAHMRSQAAELASRGIRVNAIAPGTIDTDMVRNNPPEAQEAMKAAALMKRAADPDEVAPLALYLASDASSFVTGATFGIDGGLMPR